MKFELCLNCLNENYVDDSVTTAMFHAVDTIELCSSMEEGGLTPSPEYIRAARDAMGSFNGLMVMIRLRSGNFVYTDYEIDMMLEQIDFAGESGADGIVFGCLDENDNINIRHLERMLMKAEQFSLDTTFHMAFDCLKLKQASTRILINHQIDRILTAGQKWGEKKDLKERIITLADTANLCGDDLEMVIGGGIATDNIGLLAERFRDMNIALHAYSSSLTQGKLDNRKLTELLAILKKDHG